MTGKIMTAPVYLLLAAMTLGGSKHERRGFLEFGRDPAPGLLVNLSPGTRPFDPPDPSRPSIIFIHGSNPASWIVRLTMAERFAAAVARREGVRCNILSWDWNGATVAGIHPRANHESAVIQGHRLALTIRERGLSAHQVRIVGQSLGCVVAASASRVLADSTGVRVERLVLLDPASFYHDIVFDRLQPDRSAAQVEHYWAPGPSGYSREVNREGVRNFRVDVPSPVIGIVSMPHSAHWRVVHWYIETVENAGAPGGYNFSEKPARTMLPY